MLAQETVVRIGHSAPMSGGQAHYGKDNENGARMAIDDLNAKGVTIGGKKVRFELMAEDDAADPKQGTAVAQKFCDAKVAGVVGHLNSGVTIPASKIYSDCGIPMITPSSTNPKVTQNGYKNIYRLLANDNALAAGLAFYAADSLKAKKVAVIDDRTGYGQPLAEIFKKTAESKGMQIVVEPVHHRQGGRLHGDPDADQEPEPGRRSSTAAWTPRPARCCASSSSSA